MHELGHLLQHRKQFDRLTVQFERATVELTNLAELRDHRHQARARLLGFIDHAALPLAHRRLLILVQHSQVTADDAGRRAELMNGERDQRRIGIVR